MSENEIIKEEVSSKEEKHHHSHRHHSSGEHTHQHHHSSGEHSHHHHSSSGHSRHSDNEEYSYDNQLTIKEIIVDFFTTDIFSNKSFLKKWNYFPNRMLLTGLSMVLISLIQTVLMDAVSVLKTYSKFFTLLMTIVTLFAFCIQLGTHRKQVRSKTKYFTVNTIVYFIYSVIAFVVSIFANKEIFTFFFAPYKVFSEFKIVSLQASIVLTFICMLFVMYITRPKKKKKKI